MSREDIPTFEECKKLYDTPTLRKSWEIIFRKEFGDDITIAWKDDKVSQIDFGSDVLIKTKQGRKYSIDVKGRQPKYLGFKKWTIELVHQHYEDSSKDKWIRKKEGWLYCSTADYIFYGTASDNFLEWKEYVGFSLIPFKEEEFKKNISNLIKVSAVTLFNNCFQVTWNVLMDYDFLKNNANKFWYWIEQ